ncbi:MAG: glutamine--scyllo-inositol aminotransferase [Planctomycetaceae bacterium]|nr:glutamine--scyllo-inositol aminotransferase [Planctomycetaceae bacterium]
MERIRIAKPWISNLEISYVQDAVSNGWGEKCYTYIKKLEKRFSEYLGIKHAVATSSCTGATHMALVAMGVGAGDEVIIPETTWISCASAVIYAGANPVFVDIKEDTWCIDPDKIERAISPKTKAIMPVHIYGNVAEMNEIMDIATKHNIQVIEDPAEALGAEYYGRKVGSIGGCGVFSFHGTKMATSGEGGMFVTNDDELFNKFSVLHDQGRVSEEKRMFFPHHIGYKYKISNLQAALAYAQIERIRELIQKKKEIFNWYSQSFSNFDNVKLNYQQKYAKCCYWMPILIFDKPINIDQSGGLIEHLDNHGIDSRPFFYPLSSLPMFPKQQQNSVAYDLCKRAINLPSPFCITKEEVNYVSKMVMSFLNNSN